MAGREADAASVAGDAAGAPDGVFVDGGLKYSRGGVPDGRPVKILQVIHGYPTRYNAGSEVYTQVRGGATHQHGQASVAAFAMQKSTRAFPTRAPISRFATQA